MRAAWRTWNTAEAVSHVDTLVASWTSQTCCNLCQSWGDAQLYCPGCRSWRCIACAHVDQITITKVQWCVTCKVDNLLAYRTEGEPDDAWFKVAAELCGGANALSALGGTYRYRLSAIRGLTQWGKRMALEVLPGSPAVYELFIAHRLLVEGVSIATVELDFISLSVWHYSLKALIPGLKFHNPTKQDLIRVFVKYLAKEVRLPASATVPCALWELVAMVKQFDTRDPQQLHAKICMEVHALPILRRIAAENLLVKRAYPQLHTVHFVQGSDVALEWDIEFGLCAGFRVNVDKNIPAGRWRWIWVPGRMKCGLTLGEDIYHWLTTYPVPDGPLLASPRNKAATSFNTGKFKGFDRIVAMAWRMLQAKYPEQLAGRKVVPYSLRKAMIQALDDSKRMYRKITNEDIGELVGWTSVKTDIMKHYAGMDKRVMLRMLADLDPAKLPQTVETAMVGPF